MKKEQKGNIESMKYKVENNEEKMLVLNGVEPLDTVYMSRELDLKIVNRRPVKKMLWNSVEEVSDLIKSFFNTDTIEIQEQFVAVYLNSKLEYMGHYISSKGGITSTVADSRLIFMPMIKLGAKSLIIAHNHPSNNLKPSPADIKLTEMFKKQCELMNYQLVDHFIITANGYYSFAAENEIIGLKGINRIQFKKETKVKTQAMKITRKNYFDEYSKADKSKLPKAIVETHELISQATSDGKTWDFFDSDPEMKEVELLQLEKFEQAINSMSKSKQETSKKEKIYSQSEMKNMLSKYAFDPKHPLMVIDMDAPQFQTAYKEFLQEVKKYGKKRDGYWELDEYKYKKYSFKDGYAWCIFTDNSEILEIWNMGQLELYVLDIDDENEALIEDLDNLKVAMKKNQPIAAIWIDAVARNYVSDTKNSDKVSKSKSKKKTQASTTNKKQSRTSSKKKSQAQKTDENIKYVENIDVEIQLISRYKNLHGKVKTRHSIVLLLRAIQRAIVKRQITKKSVYAKEISTMQDELIKVIQEIDKLNLDIVEVNIQNIDKYKEIARSEKRMLSVTYILRYIAISKQHDVFEKAKRLLDNIKSAIEKKKITKRDKYYDDLDEIKRRLSSYIQKDAKTLAVQPAELSGLKKRIREDVDDSGLSGGNSLATYAAGILSSIAARYIYDKKVKPDNSNDGPTSNNNVTAETVVSSEKLKDMQFETLKLDSPFNEVVGEPSKNAKMMIYGAPGSGKSTFMIIFAKSLAQSGKRVLIVADEEGVSRTLQEKLTRLDAYHQNLFVTDQLPSDNKKYDVVFYDSVQSLRITPEQLEEIAKDKSTMVGFVFQVTKEGKYKGEADFEHLVDVVVKADEGIITTVGCKNRFGGRGEMQVY